MILLKGGFIVKIKENEGLGCREIGQPHPSGVLCPPQQEIIDRLESMYVDQQKVQMGLQDIFSGKEILGTPYLIFLRNISDCRCTFFGLYLENKSDPQTMQDVAKGARCGIWMSP